MFAAKNFLFASAVPYHAPVSTPFLTPGTFSWTPPTWWRPGYDLLDTVIIPAGSSGGALSTSAGNAGATSSITGTNGGSTGYYLGLSGPTLVAGSASTLATGGTAPGTGNTTGTHTTAADGAASPGITWNSIVYSGGATAVCVGTNSITNTAGNAPGGGGAACYGAGEYGHGGKVGTPVASTWQINAYGVGIGTTLNADGTLTVVVGAGGAKAQYSGSYYSGPGASAAIWIVARQGA